MYAINHEVFPVSNRQRDNVTDGDSDTDKERNKDKDDEKLPPHWEKIHGAIWLIGLAYLFWSGNIFPGILVLVAISGIAQALIMAYVKRNQETETLAIEREVYLPEKCPSCGGPVSAATVRWKGKKVATCPYCGSTIKVSATPLTPAQP